MNLANTYTKKWAGFDNRYWITLAVLLIGSVLAFGIKKRFLYSCPIYTIPMQSVSNKSTLVKQSFLINEAIFFSVPDINYKSVEWYVDDVLKSKEQNYTQSFATSGKYVIKLTVDGKCDYTQIVNILPYKLQSVDISLNDANTLPDMVIEGNESFEAGTITYFTTPVIANAYEWQILEAPEYGIKTEQLVGYSIITPGTYTLQLKLNNDSKKIFTKKIVVASPIVTNDINSGMDAPPPTEMPIGAASSASDGESGNATANNVNEVTKTKNVLPDNEILAILKLIRDEKKSLSDLTESLCDGEKTKVLANDDKVMTLGELTEKLQSKKWALGKKPKVNSVRTVRDNNNGNCVSVIYVKYK